VTVILREGKAQHNSAVPGYAALPVSNLKSYRLHKKPKKTAAKAAVVLSFTD
jgi:hypothetical protein